MRTLVIRPGRLVPQAAVLHDFALDWEKGTAPDLMRKTLADDDKRTLDELLDAFLMDEQRRHTQ